MIVEVIIGPPGSGKTTRISHRVEEACGRGESPMVCSLTRAAAAEVKGRDLPIPREQVGTLHAHAFRSLDSPPLVEKFLSDWNRCNPHYALSGDLSDGIDPYARRLDHGPRLASKLALLRARCVMPEMWPAEVRAFSTAWERWKTYAKRMDFTDLIEQATLRETPIPYGCDTIFVDEAQDLSRLELELLRHWAGQAHRLVIVGDAWQSLYEWRGADPGMFDRVAPERRSVLSQSYRVPRAVHSAAISLAKRMSTYSPIEYRPTAVEGSVRQAGYGIGFPAAIAQEATVTAAKGRSVMIAASCGYMVNGVIEELRKAGTPFANPWRTKNGRWNPLQGGRGVSMRQRIHEFLIPIEGVSEPESRDCDEDDQTEGYLNLILTDDRQDIDSDRPRNWTVMEVARWSGALAGVLTRGSRKQIEGHGRAGGKDRIVRSSDLDDWFEFLDAGTLRKIMDGIASRKEALEWYEQHLSHNKKKPAQAALAIARWHGSLVLREQPKIFVGTIHSFKGAEADTVILAPDLSASGFREWCGSPKAKDSILRMFYVGMTRARHELIICQASSPRAADIWAVVPESMTAAGYGGKA